MRITPIALAGCGSDRITLSQDVVATSAIEIGRSISLVLVTSLLYRLSQA